MIQNYALTWIVIFSVLFLLSRLALDVLRARNMTVDFGFLLYPSNFDIGSSVLSFSGSDSYAKALLIGFINTIKAAVTCIVMSTLVGTAIGIARLSSNPLLSSLSGALIEILRNVPPLLQLFAWYAVIQYSLPLPANAWQPLWGVVLTNRGFWLPFVQMDHVALLIGGVLLGIAALLVALMKRFCAGFSWKGILLVTGAVLLLGGAAFLLSGHLALDIPQKRGFNFRGGLSVTPEFAALTISLTLYTGGYIAEILRGAVKAVPEGQREAASALGLRYVPTMRLVVLPQAVRIAIPPVTSQYINVSKSTSLAVAVGYPDIVSIGNTIMNQSGRAIEIIAIFVVAYLVLNLVISTTMNRLNRRLSLA